MRFFTISLLLLPAFCYAQSVDNDTVFLNEATRNAITLYEQEMLTQSHLINGAQYNRAQNIKADPSHPEQAHPYYVFEWLPGSVFYDGDWYNASFLYDLEKDNLIMINTFLQKQLLLVKEKVDEFTLGDHRFVKLNVEKSTGEGFYEILYDGNTKVYLKRSKTLERVVGQNVEIPYRYMETTNYFIMKGTVYHSVNSKRSVLKVLSEQESEIKKFLRLRSQSFKENRIYLISEMARLYDQLQTKK